MKQPPAKLEVRIAYEPNRFSSETLTEVYERLNPIKSRTVSKDENNIADGVDLTHVEEHK